MAETLSNDGKIFKFTVSFMQSMGRRQWLRVYVKRARYEGPRLRMVETGVAAQAHRFGKLEAEEIGRKLASPEFHFQRGVQVEKVEVAVL